MTSSSEAPGRQEPLISCYWGSVNQWECDENNHMNVRFYAHKANQALQILVSQMSNAHAVQVSAAIRAQHIRFLAETRAAAPLRIDAAVTTVRDTSSEVLSLMHDNVTGGLVAAFLTVLDTTGWDIGSLDRTVDVPESARPRGIDPEALPAPPADLESARAAGYRTVGRGVIESHECDAAGRLLPHNYVGRISDGMPNLWAHLNPPREQSARGNGELGGAALEQRLQIIEPLRAGSVFAHLSGVRSLGNKTQQMAHLLYDETHQRMAAGMEAVGVAMDLETRKAVPISPERRRHLETLLLSPAQAGSRRNG